MFYPETLDRMIGSAIKASEVNSEAYGVLIRGSEVHCAPWNWCLGNKSCIEKADYVIYVKGYLPSIEKGDQEFIYKHAHFVFTFRRGVLDEPPVSKANTRELWWQKQERLNGEAKERIVALHNDIRNIIGL